MEVNLKCWNEVYLLKIYWGSKWDLEQSTVYVIYLIQESRSLENHVLEPLDPYKMFQATNQTFVLISFILYGDKNTFAGVVVHCASLYKMLFTK